MQNHVKLDRFITALNHTHLRSSQSVEKHLPHCTHLPGWVSCQWVRRQQSVSQRLVVSYCTPPEDHTQVRPLVTWSATAATSSEHCPPAAHQDCHLQESSGIKSLSNGRCWNNFTSGIFKQMQQIQFMSTSFEIALKWMSQNTVDGRICLDWDSNFTEVCSKRQLNDYSSLVQIMAWHQTGNFFQS